MNRTMLDWLKRERQKLKDALSQETNESIRQHIKKELSLIAARILESNHETR